jgi:AGZA family xanthine/uracil permease-like MFS transporter
VIFTILAVTRAIEYVDAAVPTTLKRAVAAGIGLFIAYIGLQSGGIIVPSDATQVTLGKLTEPGPLLTLIGILIIAVLMARKVRGAILIGILLTTVVSFFMGIKELPTGLGDIFGMPASLAPIAGQLDLRAALSIPFFVIFSFLFVDVFDTMGTLLGTGARAGFLDEKGRLPRVNRAMLADAIGTMGGALLGTSTVTTYVESTAGVSEGGRTGLTSIVTGLLFFLSLFLAPLAGLVPAQATAPALVIVGVLMVGGVMKIDFDDFTEALPAFLTIIFMPLAYSIADGIAFGFIAYPVVKLVAGKWKEVHWLVYLLAVVALVHFFYPA